MIAWKIVRNRVGRRCIVKVYIGTAFRPVDDMPGAFLVPRVTVLNRPGRVFTSLRRTFRCLTYRNGHVTASRFGIWCWATRRLARKHLAQLKNGDKQRAKQNNRCKGV